MRDADIRNNLLGLIIGAIPPTAACVALVLDYLLDRPALLEGAQQAARERDRLQLRAYVQEALRLNPFGPGLHRVARADYRLASGTLRSKKIRKGALVCALTQSAMRDGRELDRPRRFLTDRPDYHYLHFGCGLHACFGKHLSLIQLVHIVGCVLRRDQLRRVPGAQGRLQYEGPFPRHLVLEFNRPDV